VTRRNSPSIGQLGGRAAARARTLLTDEFGLPEPTRTPPMPKVTPPAQPKQAAMLGMETSAAVSMVAALQRDKQKRAEKNAKPEEDFAAYIQRYKLPTAVRGHKFAVEELGRKWAFDFAFMQFMTAVEIEGLNVQRVHIATMGPAGNVIKTTPTLICRGRHASVEGFSEDCIKYAAAARLGWTVIRFTTKQVADQTAINETMRVLHAKGWRR